MNMRLLITVAVVVSLVAGYLIMKAGVRSGKTIFMQEGCIKCHHYKNIGFGAINLSDVTQKRSDVWIRDQIRNPRLHDPIAGMPSFSFLSEAEIKALIRFLHGEGS